MKKETNLEHYKKRLKRILKENYKEPIKIFYSIQKYIDPEIKITSSKYTDSILEWMVQEYKPKILDKVEKKYLSEVIRPFRKNSIEIVKLQNLCDQDYIRIRVGFESFDLPSFEKETMYKGMEYCQTYKPEELGL